MQERQKQQRGLSEWSLIVLFSWLLLMAAGAALWVLEMIGGEAFKALALRGTALTGIVLALGWVTALLFRK